MKKYFSFAGITLALLLVYFVFNFEDTKAKNTGDDAPYQVCVIDEAGNPVNNAHVRLISANNIYDLGYTEDIGCVPNYYSGSFCVDVVCGSLAGSANYTFYKTGTGVTVTVRINGPRCPGL